jgi:P-type Cu2+ transporter
MNAVAATLAAGAEVGSDVRDSTCFHCGQSLPTPAPLLQLDGQQRAFCCTGCAAAASWIRDAHLDAYYRLRSDPGGRAIAATTDLAAWDHEDVLAVHARDIAGGREIALLTDGMRCAACAWLIDRALAREPGVLEVSANAVTGRIRVAWNPQARPLSAILQRLLALGYRPYLAGGAADEIQRRAERRRWLLRVGLAGLATLQAMMFSEALYLDTAHQMPLPTRDFFRWITFLVATPVVFFAGWPFLVGAWQELRARRLGMDTLIATSTLLAWGASTVETMRGGPHVWFDTAVMFVFVLLVARLLEQRARQRSRAHVDTLALARPVLATRETAAGTTEAVPLGRLAVGDITRVAPGDTLPADGELLDAAAAFDESLLTGESRPVTHQPGATILAGTICTDQLVRLRITSTGAATQLSALARLVQAAQAHRPRMARLADKVASRFVIGLAIVAALVYWHWHTVDPARAFEVTLALLVISCPCALSLAIPAALAAAHSGLAHGGVIAARPDALETLAAATDVVFDKTGTLGSGAWEIVSVTAFTGCTQAQATALAAALERDVRHPLATAFRCTSLGPTASAVRLQAGQGIEGMVDGRPLRLGVAQFATGRSDDGAIWLGDGSTPLARFELREQPRQDTAPALATLASQGLRLHLFSGDSANAVQRFAHELGEPFESFAGRLLPQDKLDRVRALQSQGRVVAMVGDGVNDAPVLAGADVSIALAEGAALAQQAADLVVISPSLLRIADAVRTARRSRSIIRQNLAWAIGYNLLALPLAASGMVTPWVAALAMVLSSLTVTLNALRLVAPART